MSTIIDKIKWALNTDVLSIWKWTQIKSVTTNATEYISDEVKWIIDVWYTKEQRNTYFNPVTSDTADINELAKIIQWKILNPFKLKDPNSHTDCTFFVAWTFWWLDNLPLTFDVNTPDELYKCDWFGLFTINRNSQIVIPNKIVIDISEDKKSLDVNIVDKNVWKDYDWWFFQLDKNIKKKIIKSDVDENTMHQILKKIFWDVMFL